LNELEIRSVERG